MGRAVPPENRAGIEDDRADQRLAGAARAGDPAAWEELVARHEDGLRRRFAARTGDPHAAADLTQEVFLIAWTRRECLRPDLPLGPWLFRIAHFVLLRWWRGQGRREALLDALLAEGGHGEPAVPPEELGAVEAWDVAERALAGLPPSARRAVALRAVGDLTARQVGMVLGVTEAAAEQRLARATRLLRRWAAELALLLGWATDAAQELLSALAG